MTCTPCSRLTRAGRPCRAWAVPGTRPPLCMAHAMQTPPDRRALPGEPSHALACTRGAGTGVVGPLAGPPPWALGPTLPPADAAAAREPTPTPSFYAPRLRPDEVADLVALADDRTLHDEIALARVALRRLLEELIEGHDDDEDEDGSPSPADGPLSGRPTRRRRLDVGRVAFLVFQGTRTVAHLLREQQALSSGTGDGVCSVLDLALDELSLQLEIRL